MVLTLGVVRWQVEGERLQGGLREAEREAPPGGLGVVEAQGVVVGDLGGVALALGQGVTEALMRALKVVEAQALALRVRGGEAL